MNPNARTDPPARGAAAGDGPRRPWWVLGVAVTVAALVLLVLADRRRPAPGVDSATAAPTTTAPVEVPPYVSARQFSVPEGLEGTMFVLDDGEFLTEVDLATGAGRVAPLAFAVDRWSANQVVPLEDAVLVVTGRELWAVDRASLLRQHRIGTGVWAAAAADGTWAVLVPYDDVGAAVTIVDSAGRRMGRFVLPSGVSVVGVTGDHVLVDAAGTLGLIQRDGRPGPPLGADGRPIALGASDVARIVCRDGQDCDLRSGPLGALDAHSLPAPILSGEWSFGPAGALHPEGTLLAYVAVGSAAGDQHARVVDLASGATSDSPITLGRVGPIPPLAFTPGGSALAHTASSAVVLWWPTPGAANGAPPPLAALGFDAEPLAIGMSDVPPPPPDPSSGPPPSFL